MGDYTSESKIMSLMPQLPVTGSAGYTASSALVTQAIADAEAEINGYVARRYSLPFTDVPVQIRAIADGLAVFYSYMYLYSSDSMNRNDFTDDPRYKIQLSKLSAIADGEIRLTLTNGSAVVEPSSSSEVVSGNMRYATTFDVDTCTSWGVDSDRITTINDDRT
jgi:phage gp36-like protein